MASANYDSIDPLDGRYFDEELTAVLSERTAVGYQAKVEAALALTLSEFSICPPTVAKEIEQASQQITVEEVYAEEATTKHNIKALVNCIKEKVSDEAKPFVHLTATSYDIISTAQAMQYRDAINSVIMPRFKALLEVLIKLSNDYAETVQIGRTHGQHALPITFGFAIAEYVSRLGQSAEATKALTVELRGKFSGAVGAANALGIFVDDAQKFEQQLLGHLDLKPAEYSTQIAPPEFLIRLLDELGIAAGVMANLATDMRHLQRSEIAEIRERFEEGQTGSSTMAHKRNPWNFENVVSMNKQVIAQLTNAQLNLASEHQRDLTDSASSRFYPILVACVAEMAQRLNTVLPKIEVDEQSMIKNLQMSRGAIAAEPLYLLLAKAGYPTAHEKSKELAIKAQDTKADLVSVIESDSEAKAYWDKFSDAEKQIISQPEKYYTGIASSKARSVASHWQAQLENL
jgi:adenylosuccinate lyase